jgi:DNA-binding transcriptional ArsR family regulator
MQDQKLCRPAKFSLAGIARACIVSDMAKHDPHLDLLFHALSDPTRRMMLNRLARGPAGVSELAGPTGLRLPTIMRHLSVLEEAGLVTSAKDGRVRSCAFEPQAMEPMRHWLDGQRQIWEGRLDRLDDYVMKLMKERQNEK